MPLAARPGLRWRMARNFAWMEGRLRDRAMQAVARLRGRAPREQLYLMPPYWSKVPLLGRAGSTDWMVFQQVFVQEEYGIVNERDDVRCIVDCGANVGYTTAWLLSRFPAARSLVIEPDPDNFELLQRNLSQFGNRVAFMRAAVWSHDAPLKLVHDPAVGEWGIQVRECVAGETPDAEGVSMTTVLANAPPPGHVDLLKMDIEGGETAVFGASPGEWLPRVSLCIVELHDERARETFEEAIAQAPFDVTYDILGEIATARRRKP